MILINRRDFLIGLSGFTFYNLYAPTRVKSHENQKEQTMEHYDMQLRPHHILDIISDHGKGTEYQPHPYGHSLHLVAPRLLADLDLKIRLVLQADDICQGCMHLLPDGKCNDVLVQLTPSPSKQAYNDVLDSRLFDDLSMMPGTETTTRAFLEAVNAKVPGIEKICTHPKENQDERLKGLIDGLTRVGVRPA